MPNRPPADDEEVLERLLTGDLDREDPNVIARLDDDADFARKLDELERLASEMGRLGDEQRELWDAARERTGAPGEERVVDAVRDFVRAEGSSEGSDVAVEPPSTRPRPVGWIALAAAAALAVFAAILGTGGDESGGDGREADEAAPVMLGDALPDTAGFAPSGPVPAFDELRWTLDLPTNGWFDVQVFAEGADVLDPPLWERRTGRSSLAVPPEVARSWPNEIEWSVEAFDASGASVASSPPVRASRSSR